MKRLTLPLLMVLSPTALADWALANFPHFSEQPSGIFTSSAELKKGEYPLALQQNNQCWQPTSAVKLNQTFSLQPCEGQAPIAWRSDRMRGF